ncbi:MAG: hypothetical protein ACREM2_09785, partial [Vulcanimicrobiaceae bacterium]
GARFVRRRAPAGDRAQAMRSSPTSDIPLGAFALAWLGRVEFERTSGYGRLLAAAIGAAALGLLTGAGMEAGGDGAGALLASVGTSAITVVVLLALVLVPMETARKIARDLAVPLWWIAADPLPRRLLVWSLASALPGALAAAALPLALLIALQSPLEALAAALATAILWWSIVALGLFVFTIFPNRLESRGPLMYLWMLGLVAYLFPPFAAFTIALVTARAPLVGLGAALVIVAVEGYITLQLAAGRIARHGLAIAREGR